MKAVTKKAMVLAIAAFFFAGSAWADGVSIQGFFDRTVNEATGIHNNDISFV